MTERADKIRQERDRQTQRVSDGKAAPLNDHFECAVVGVSFVDDYPDNLHQLDELGLEATMRGERLPVIIVREPDNEHDANACAVHVPALGERGKIGMVTRPLAARLAPELDAGIIWQGEVTYVRVHPDMIYQPGITVSLHRVKEDAHG